MIRTMLPYSNCKIDDSDNDCIASTIDCTASTVLRVSSFSIGNHWKNNKLSLDTFRSTS